MSSAEQPLDDAIEVDSARSAHGTGHELRQRSVRDLVAELAQLEDAVRCAASSPRVVAGTTARAHRIVAELRRR